ncbi:MAG: tripartite tricarboxylate transporter substrate binding protein [Pseudomonadota bacterium]
MFSLVIRIVPLILALSTGLAGAQSFPQKPVRMVVPYTPAGPVDFTTRVLQSKLQELWGQTVLVENRPGASGMIGCEFVAKASPDGYTLLVATIQTHAMNVGTIKKMLYDPLKDFTPITQVTRANWVLAVHPSLGVRSYPALVSYIKARPGKVSYGSSGVGGTSHLAFELLGAASGLKMLHVPYKGTAQALNDVIQGQVQMIIGDLPTLLPQIKAGRIVGIAVTSSVRAPTAPELPTIAEAGVPGFDVQPWQGVFGPPGMPAELVRKINADIIAVLRMPEIRDRFATSGVEPAESTPQEFAAFLQREVGRWTEAARVAGITPE